MQQGTRRALRRRQRDEEAERVIEVGRRPISAFICMAALAAPRRHSQPSSGMSRPFRRNPACGCHASFPVPPCKSDSLNFPETRNPSDQVRFV
ncbi:hypothetical protein MRX96_035504 [Rhipicephalus microplus]